MSTDEETCRQTDGSLIRKRSTLNAEEETSDNKDGSLVSKRARTEAETSFKNESCAEDFHRSSRTPGPAPDQSNEASAGEDCTITSVQDHASTRQSPSSNASGMHSNGQELTPPADDVEHGASSASPAVKSSENSDNMDGEEESPEGGYEGVGKHYNLRSSFTQSDTLRYRSGYPGKEDDPDINDNYRFYANEIPSEPDGDFIDKIHSEWWGQYLKLEYHHGYIQWLFPIRERGLNYHSQELQLHEAKRICSDPIMHARVLKSYELMLDFYGMKLKDNKTGEIERSNNWKERFHHLNHSSHNYLRITRILKCLGEMEYEYLKAPFLRFVLHEAIEEGTLDRTLDSCMNYWLEVLKDDQERASIRNIALDSN